MGDDNLNLAKQTSFPAWTGKVMLLAPRFSMLCLYLEEAVEFEPSRHIPA
jgi:hypothetical protein